LEFHIWDFSDRIEARLNDDFIEKLKTFKRTKTSEFLHWRSKQKIAVTRNYWIFPEATPIGKRLFTKWDYHRNSKKLHLPFVTVSQLKEIHRKTRLSLDEIEKAVTHVRVQGSNVSVALKFPVIPNIDWAFLMGLWFGAGGYVTRFREGKAQEKTLRFAVDPRPYRELMNPLLLRLGYSSHELKTVYYAKAGGHHKLDAQKWRQYGSEPRGVFILHRYIREIMEKFGLPDSGECKAKRKLKGGKSSFRQCSREIPEWVKNNIEFSHAFIEGYLNGQSTASQFHPSYPHRPLNPLTRFVEPRFMGKESIVRPFYDWFAKFMTEKENITGYEHHLPLKHRDQANIELGYLIINNHSLRKLFEQFRIMRSDTRARLILHYYLNPLMYELCRRLECFETLLLGAIMEAPWSAEELTRDFRASKIEVLRTLTRLYQDFKAIKPQGAKWVLQDGFKNMILAELHAQEDERCRKIGWMSERFFSECDKCGDVVAKNYVGRPCKYVDCKGKYQPIAREEIIKHQHLHKQQFATRSHRVQASKLPSFSMGVMKVLNRLFAFYQSKTKSRRGVKVRYALD
jgi:hypothetical protein